MNSITTISLTTLLLCSVSSNLLAQTAITNSSWYIMPSAAVFMPDSGFGLDGNGAAFGITLGRSLSQEWDIQISTKYGHQNSNGLNYQQNTLGADVLYMFNREKVRPFLLVGAGYQEDRVSSSFPNGDASGYAPYINGGLGVQISLDEPWTLQLDFRRERGYLKSDSFNSNRNNNNYVSVGLSYAFD